MSRTAYYERLCQLARTKRVEHGVRTAALDLPGMQRIYKAEGIRIDRWEVTGRALRAAYFCDDGDCSVLVNKNLPREPKLFSLAHELKHHYEDQELIACGKIECGDYNANELIEKGAEVFAAEFIYPQAEMLQLVEELAITASTCTPEKIVEFKRACAAHISYSFIVKRFEWFGLCPPGAYKKTRFQKLEESIHGVPFYKQDWFKRHRARKRVGAARPD